MQKSRIGDLQNFFSSWLVEDRADLTCEGQERVKLIKLLSPCIHIGWRSEENPLGKNMGEYPPFIHYYQLFFFLDSINISAFVVL